MASDGSLVFDTQIDTGGTRKELAELQQNFYDVNKAITSQIKTVEELEMHYRDLQAEARRATNPEDMKKYERVLEKVNNELEDEKKKLIELRMQSNELKASFKEFAAVTEKVGNGLTSLGKRILGLARRVFIFTIIARALRDLRSMMLDAIPGMSDLQTSFNELKVAIVRAAAPLMSVLVPALRGVINYVVEFVNSIRSALTFLLQLFGADVADDAEVTKKATDSLSKSVSKLGKSGKKAVKDLASFDEIIKIGTSVSGGEASGIEATGAAAQEAIKPLSTLQELMQKIAPYLIGGLFGGMKGVGVAAIVDGITTSIKALKNILDEGLNWSNLGKNLEGSLKTIGGAALIGGAKGAGVAAILMGVKDAIIAAKSIIEKGLNWQNLALNLQSNLELIGGAALIGGAKGAGVAAILIGVRDAFLAARKIIEDGINWQNLALNLQSDLELIGGAALVGGGKGAGVAAIIIGIKNAILASKKIIEDGLNWQNLALNLQGNLELIGGAALIGGAKGAGVAAILLGVKDAVLAVKDIVDKGITWDNIALGLQGVVEVIEGLFLLLTVGKLSGGAAIGAALGSMAVSGGLILALNEMIKTFQDIAKNGATWQSVLKALALGLDIVAAAMVLVNISNPVTGILALMGAIATLAAFIVEKWESIKKTVGEIWKWIKGKVEDVKKWFKGTWLGKLFGGGSKELKVTRQSQILAPPNTSFTVPALARGAVIPPNNPYLAVVGDQKQGTNIEAPLETMVNAFKQALAETGFGNAVMQVDGTTFARLVYKYNNAESTRVGVDLLTRE